MNLCLSKTPPQTPPHKGEGLNLPRRFAPLDVEQETLLPILNEQTVAGVGTGATDWPLPLVGRGSGAGSSPKHESARV
jgi:hypothetical protein